MKDSDNTMSVRPPRAGVSQGSQTTTNRVAGTPGGVASAEKAASTNGGDTVTLTSSVDQMLKLEESLAKIPDVDSARVTDIKASIADGSYEIDAEKIVDNLLKIEKDFS